MDRLREPHTAECHAFLNSTEFTMYAMDFYRAYLQACRRVNLDPIDRTKWPQDWDKIGRFCQEFWDCLPEDSRIRRGAFFKLCDFAEDWCFGDHGI